MASFFMLAAILLCLISTSSAYDFYVGGRAGWVENPKESYNNWAGRMRFQVNDKLVFKYKKTGDSVLVVKKEDYDSCNGNNPIQKLQGGGDSASFQFNRSGPFFFVSGAQDGCSKGQKMIVVVMAVRGNKPLPPPPATAPTPSLQPPTSSPSPSPSPPASPIAAPTPSPSAGEPSPSPSPTVSPPGPAPSSVIGGGGWPTGNEPEASAPPAKSSSSALTASSVTIGTVALVFAHAFLG